LNKRPTRRRGRRRRGFPLGAVLAVLYTAVIATATILDCWHRHTTPQPETRFHETDTLLGTHALHQVVLDKTYDPATCAFCRSLLKYRSGTD
jgi:hypothetical protein